MLNGLPRIGPPLIKKAENVITLYQDLMKDENGKLCTSFKTAAVARGMIFLIFQE